MEEQLAAYRQQKANAFTVQPKSSTIFNWFRKKQGDAGVLRQRPTGTGGQEREVEMKTLHKAQDTSGIPSCTRYFDEASALGDGTSKFKSGLLLILKVTLWLILWGLFIEIGFGAVYFVLSVLLFVYFNTRTGPKTEDGPSAYSVFNPNCERLDGTFTAEQFEKELRYGPASVH